MYQTYMEQSKSKEVSGNVGKKITEAVVQEVCILLNDSIKLCYFEWCLS